MNTTTVTMSEIMERLMMLGRQGVILPGNKAIVQDGVLDNDRIYESTGNIGRWAMNTFLRPTKNTAHRRDVCKHVERMVTDLGDITSSFACDIHVHEIVEYHIGRLLQTIASLLQIYPLELGNAKSIEQNGPTGDEYMQAHTVLETCMVRLLDLSNTNNVVTITDNTEIHV